MEATGPDTESQMEKEVGEMRRRKVIGFDICPVQDDRIKRPVQFVTGTNSLPAFTVAQALSAKDPGTTFAVVERRGKR